MKTFLGPLDRDINEMIQGTFALDGFLVTGSSSGRVKLYSLETGQPLISLRHSKGLNLHFFRTHVECRVTQARLW